MQRVHRGASSRPPGGAVLLDWRQLGSLLFFLQCGMPAGGHAMKLKHIHGAQHCLNAPLSLPRAVVVLPARSARGLLFVSTPAILLLRLLGVVLGVLLLAIAVLLLPSCRLFVVVLLPLLCLLSLALHLEADLQQLCAVYVGILAHPQPAVGQIDVFDSLQQEQKQQRADNIAYVSAQAGQGRAISVALNSAAAFSAARSTAVEHTKQSANAPWQQPAAGQARLALNCWKVVSADSTTSSAGAPASISSYLQRAGQLWVGQWIKGHQRNWRCPRQRVQQTAAANSSLLPPYA